MEENFGNTEPGEGPDQGDRVAEKGRKRKTTLSTLLEAGFTAQDPSMFRASVHRRRTMVRMWAQ